MSLRWMMVNSIIVSIREEEVSSMASTAKPAGSSGRMVKSTNTCVPRVLLITTKKDAYARTTRRQTRCTAPSTCVIRAVHAAHPFLRPGHHPCLPHHRLYRLRRLRHPHRPPRRMRRPHRRRLHPRLSPLDLELPQRSMISSMRWRSVTLATISSSNSFLVTTALYLPLTHAYICISLDILCSENR